MPKVTPEELKERMKKIGISPPGSYQEKPTYISSTGAILDQYVPVEGDGKASVISTDGAKQVSTWAPWNRSINSNCLLKITHIFQQNN